MVEPSEEELLAELHAAAEVLGRAPTVREMREHGEFSTSQYERYFGSWNAALREAGLDINMQRAADRAVGQDEFLANIQKVAAIVDGAPSKAQFKRHGDCSLNIYKKWYDRWAEALVAAKVLKPAE